MPKKTLYEKHKRNHEDIVLSFDNLLQNLLISYQKAEEYKNKNINSK